MAMKLSEVRAKQKITTVHWDGEEVDICYSPAMVTPEMLGDVLDKVNSGEAASSEINSVPALLEPILVWWDVLDDDGQRIPTDAEHIRKMPMPFLGEVVKTTQQDMAPGNQKG